MSSAIRRTVIRASRARSRVAGGVSASVAVASSCKTKRLSSADSESPRWHAASEKRRLASTVIQVDRWADVPMPQDLNTPNETRTEGIRSKFRETHGEDAAAHRQRLK